jgi:colanic acid biosynthesis glycosyl transferase WcaI
MRFVILTQYFPPEIGGAATRLSAMAEELRRLGHEVEVVTALPNYPRGRFFAGYDGAFYRREILRGVEVHRVWLYPALGGGFNRMMNYGSFATTSLLGMLRAKRPDFLFVESPPLLLAISGWIASRFWRVPLIFNVADLWPDAIAEGGFIKEGLLLRAMRALERWSYRKATYVNAVTAGIREALVHKKSVPREKVLFLPNGVDTIRYQPQPPDAALKRCLGLEGKRIILWAGTQGHSHGLEYVLQAARILEDKPAIHFLFLGDGSARPGLERLAAKMGLQNVTFHDPVPLDELPSYFSISESGLASLSGIPLHDGARPSKVFPILASGKPVIFAGRGEGARLIEESGAGLVVPPEDPQSLASAVVQLLSDPALAEECGVNGRKFVEEHHQWSQLVGRWLAGLRRSDAEPAVRTRFNEV